LNGSDDSIGERGFVNAAQVTPSYLGRLDKAVSVTITSLPMCRTITTSLQYLEKKKAGLAVLEEWKHVNCLAATACDNIRDDILRQLLLPDKREVPESKPERLLAAVDLDQLCAAVKVKSMTEVQGGTITFVFEKTDKVLEEG